MKYIEFIEEVRNNVEKLCPNDKVSVETIVKNNSTKFYGIVIKKEGDNVSPTIYLEKYFEDFKCGRKIENIASEIVEIDVRSRDDIELKIDTYCDYDSMKEVLMFKIINTERNSELLAKVPHREYLDLSIVYYCLVPDVGGNIATWTVSNEVMKLWKVDEEVLYNKAIENTIQIMPYSTMSITDVIYDMITDEHADEGILEELLELNKGPQMFVVTNKHKIFGASAIVYPEVLKEFAIHNGDFYILPSSIHEVILVPVYEKIDRNELLNMVKDVNAQQVPPEEILSDEVYFYDSSKKKLYKLSE